MDQQIRVLVVDDDEPHAEAVAESLERVGYECAVATSGREGLRLIEEQDFDIVITDLIMDGVGGLEVLAKAKHELPDAEVVILTGHGTIKTAVTAMQAGATTYLTKPLDIGELRTVVDKASQSQRLARSNLELQRQLNERFGFEGVVGNSPSMHTVVAKLRQIAPTSATVLITGESGTGKELVAKALHINSPRRNKPFVPLNCAALSENILESELFGHIKGAFTGADRERKGRFEHANGGTLFLDEVGDIPIGHADQAPARPGIGRDRPRRHQRADQGERPADLGHEPRPDRGDRQSGHVPAGPLPPAQGRQRQAPAAPLASGGHPPADRLLPQGIHRVARQDGHVDLARRAQDPDVLRLAGQRPRAEEHDREHGRHRLRRRPRPRRPDRGPPGRLAHRATGGGHLATSSASRWTRSRSTSSPRPSSSPSGNREEAAKILGIGERTLYRKLKEYQIS